MGDIWITIVQLPLMLILAFIVGYEPVIFMGVGLFGMIFWLFGEDPKFKRDAFIVFLIGEAFFVISVLFYIYNGQVPAKDPFQFLFIISAITFFGKIFR